MLSLHYRDNPVELFKKFKIDSSGDDFKGRVEALHEELVEWFVDNEEFIKSSSPEISRNIGSILSSAGDSISRGGHDRAEFFYSQLLRELEELYRQVPFLKRSKKNLDRCYNSWKSAFLPQKIFVSEEFVHLLKKLDFQELVHASKGVEEIQKYHELVHKITTGVHNHHDVPKSLKYYPKSRLWGVRCGNRHELLIFSYHPETGAYYLCDYIDYHTHNEAISHRGRYYEIYEIGSRTEKTYNFRRGETLSTTSKENSILYPFELSSLTTEELELLGV